MGLRESVRNFFYATSHADQLVQEHKTAKSDAKHLSSQNAHLLEQSVADATQLIHLQQSMQNAIEVLLPKDPTLNQLENLYKAIFMDLDRAGSVWAGNYQSVMSVYGFMDHSASGREDLDKIIYTNTLVSLGVLPKSRQVSQLSQEAMQRYREELGAHEMPGHMPVGKIDYLATNGTIGESVEFHDAAGLVMQAKSDNFYGTPIALTIYSDPETGKHINASWTITLDPAVPCKMIPYEEKKPPLAYKISDTEAKKPAQAAHESPADPCCTR